MKKYRHNLPAQISGSRIIRINDYLLSESTDIKTGIKSPLDLETSNVLQFFLEDGSKISVRPSGTEPKIKYYFSVNCELHDASEFESKEAELEDRIDSIIKDMRL